MRLLHANDGGSLTLTEFEPDNVPPYAILSHTWLPQADEVTYEDVCKKSGKTKGGFKKLKFCRDQSRTDGLLYFWVDTCCIKREDSSELSEAINSMFRWYKKAHRCYVYLSDVSTPSKLPKNKRRLWQWTPGRQSPATTVAHDAPHLDVQSWLGSFQRSRYWTRGWTLQELLAPDRVNFYSREGFFLGDKKSLQAHIAGITGIPAIALENLPLSAFSAVDRFQWAAKRETKKQEDHAYCLLGIFGVSMPLVYGEGRSMAEHRLRKAIAEAPRPDHTQSDAHDVDELIEFNNRRKFILQSLHFPEMGARRDAIRNAHTTTCDWFLTHDTTTSWNDPSKLDEHRGLLWVNGKPGTGKSTIMKFALDHAEAHASRNDIIISFFFNARGTELERTTAGLYRALLFQLCDGVKDLQRILVQGADDSARSGGRLSRPPRWTRHNLCLMLSAVVGNLGQRRLRCFIDALDECSEDEIREMLEYFELLLGRARESGNIVHVCFSSRHYPAINVRYGQRLILEAEAGHESDMQKYVNARLRAGDSTKVEEIKKRIKEKANGVFMWVVLVVEILNKEFLRGRIFAVEKRLDDTPAELSELFKDMLRRDDENMDDLRLCLQWLLFARRPLRRQEFYFAMVAGLYPGSENMFRWNREALTTTDMNNFLLSCSKGLAERTSSGTVQFIHESVRDFLLKDKGLAELWPDLQDAERLSHDRLKQCCLNYLSSLSPRDSEINSSGSATRFFSSHEYPFINYATSYILSHAEAAASSVPQDKFLLDFPLSRWLSQSLALGKRVPEGFSLLGLLTFENCPRLIDAWSRKRTLIGGCGKELFFEAIDRGHRSVVRELLGLADDERSAAILASIKWAPGSWRTAQTPLLWALENNHQEIAHIIIQSMESDASSLEEGYFAEETSEKEDSKEDNHEEEYSEEEDSEGESLEDEIFESLVDVRDDNGRTALSFASEKGYYSLCDWALARGAEVDSTDKSGRTPLSYAADQGCSGTVRLLIDHGADFNFRDAFSTTPLMLAAAQDHLSTVVALVNAGADVEARDEHSNTALLRSAEAGAWWAMRLLLTFGASVKHVNDEGETALHKAAIAGQVATVETLLDNGAAINATCRVIRVTALDLATRAGHSHVVKALLDRGANLHLTNVLRKTALYEAALLDRQDIVDLLLRYGADIGTADLSGVNKLYWTTEPKKAWKAVGYGMDAPRKRLVVSAVPTWWPFSPTTACCLKPWLCHGCQDVFHGPDFWS